MEHRPILNIKGVHYKVVADLKYSHKKNKAIIEEFKKMGNRYRIRKHSTQNYYQLYIGTKKMYGNTL